MDNPYFQMTVPGFIRALTNLRAILEKAEAYAKEKQISESELLERRFAPDMYPFVAQVRIMCDNAKGGAARLAGIEVPKMEDNETTFKQLIERVVKTEKFLESIKPSLFENASTKEIFLPWMPEGMYYTAESYLTQFLLANFYFHYTTAYDLLRSQGVPLGKADFIGHVPMLKADK